MKITFCYDREKPFADARGQFSDDDIHRYGEAAAAAFRARYPDYEIAVEALDAPPGDVTFEPEEAWTAEERLAIALELRRIAHRLADETLGARLREAAGADDSSGPPPQR